MPYFYCIIIFLRKDVHQIKIGGNFKMIFAGEKIKNRYRADFILGRGGMGEVWKCFDEHLQRFVVLKVVSSNLIKSNPAHSSIFIDEARIGAFLVGHPNVVTVFDVIDEEVNGDPFLAIVMEFVEGLSCHDWIAHAKKTLDVQTRYYVSLQIALEACKALNYAHRFSILHRDIKPLNLFVSKYGVTKIGDFGIARYSDAVTRTHTVWNFRSPAYSAPEQWRDERPDHKTDIYQIGCTIYEILTGRPVFEAGSVAALIGKHLNATPDSPSKANPLIDEEISDLILNLLSKEREDRHDLWRLINSLANRVQKKFLLRIDFDKNNLALTGIINGITEFDHEELKRDGFFVSDYHDYNEALSEAMELSLLNGVSVKLTERP